MNDTSQIRVRVVRKTVEAEDIAGFELVGVDGLELPPFQAGAHIDVHIAEGTVRQYSLCNRPGERGRYEIAVLKEADSRGGSSFMHEVLKAGDLLTIGPPRNLFSLSQTARRSLLFAGGIGVTPILAMAEHLSEAGADFEFHYATRSAARTAFAERIRASCFADRTRFHMEDAGPAARPDLAKLLATPVDGTHIYVCGPKGFLDAVRATAADAGWSPANVHHEYFSGASAHDASDRHFDVVIRSTGAVIRVEAAQTVAQALEANGVQVPTSCEQGVCGTCLTRVLEGEIDHKDLFLSPEEQAANDQFLPCCSRAKSSRIVLDL